jgi:uncharacterized protein
MKAPQARITTDQVSLDHIRDLIVREIHPEQIIIFGSTASDTRDAESDLDILVIAQSALPHYRRPAPIYKALAKFPMPVDVLVYTPDEVAEWSEVPQAFITTAIREGKVIYEKG